MKPFESLLHEAIHYEIVHSDNPFLTKETIVLRLYRNIAQHTRVLPLTQPHEKTLLFHHWHPDILTAYEALRSSLSHDERACVERVLSKDSPHPSELTKFACCWYKYQPEVACRWFAVDGFLGPHPKLYVQEAFHPHHARHNEAVRALYAYFASPEKIHEVVSKAFLWHADGEPCPADLDPDFEQGVALYAEGVGEADLKRVAAERRAKLSPQNPGPATQAPKRKKSTASST